MGIMVLMVVSKIVVIWLLVNIDVSKLKLVEKVINSNVIINKVSIFFLRGMLNSYIVMVINNKKLINEVVI